MDRRPQDLPPSSSTAAAPAAQDLVLTSSAAAAQARLPTESSAAAPATQDLVQTSSAAAAQARLPTASAAAAPSAHALLPSVSVATAPSAHALLPSVSVATAPSAHALPPSVSVATAAAPSAAARLMPFASTSTQVLQIFSPATSSLDTITMRLHLRRHMDTLLPRHRTSTRTTPAGDATASPESENPPLASSINGLVNRACSGGQVASTVPGDDQMPPRSPGRLVTSPIRAQVNGDVSLDIARPRDKAVCTVPDEYNLLRAHTTMGRSIQRPSQSSAKRFCTAGTSSGSRDSVVSSEGWTQQQPSCLASVNGYENFWSTRLPADLVWGVASCLEPLRSDVENMRWVCRAWRDAIPSTFDPCLVLSDKNPDVTSEVLFLEASKTMNAAAACMKRKLPRCPPPHGTSCWGSALGLIALQSHESGENLVYCIQCGNSKTMLELPVEMTPKAIYLEPYTPQRFLLVCFPSGKVVLRVDRDDFPWILQGGPWWLPTPGFADKPLCSLALSPGVLRAGASNYSIIIIDESGRVVMNDGEVLQLRAPPFYLSDGSVAIPWTENGCHLFICEKKLHFAEIYDSSDAPEGVVVRLFLVEKSGDNEYTLVPTSDIGKFAVYLGPNQSLVLPSSNFLIGRLANTVYIEDYRGYARKPRVLALSFDNSRTIAIPFPEDVKSVGKEWLPAVWVGTPCNKDLTNHCQNSDCWRFWD